MIIGVVAAVAIAIAAPYLAPIALGALSITASATAVAIATALIATTLSVGLAFGMRALGVGSIPSARSVTGPPSVFRQSISESFIIYGKRRVGGLMVFFHGKPGVTNGNHLRYFVIAVAGHRCQGVVQWMLNDEVVTVDGSGEVTSGKYAGLAWLWFQRGLASETANSTFVAECGGKWTTAHKGNGIAAIYAKFELSDAVIQLGMPNITAVIEGKDDILDTRDSSVGYTRNAALIFYDWMQIAREEGGFGAYPDEIPDDTWISAQANVCDETVDSEDRYAIDAVITTGASPKEVRDALVVNMAGSYTFTGGKHLMRPGYWVPVSLTLSENDLAGPVQVSPFMPSDAAANEVQGTYISPDDGYQGSPFPTQSVASSDVRQMDLDLAFITSSARAARIARIMLNRAQYEKTVVWPMNITGLKVQAMDNVQLASARYGLDNYAWSVVGWGLSPDWGVVAQLREENEDIYGALVPVTPPTVPVITKPTAPVSSLSQIQSILRQTYPRNMDADAIDAGSDATIRLYGATTADTFVMDYPGLPDPTVGPISITGLAFSTAYYTYVDVDPETLQPAAWGAATVYGDSLNSEAHPYRISLGRKVITPADGGSSTSGSGLGGGYSGGGTSTGGFIP